MLPEVFNLAFTALLILAPCFFAQQQGGQDYYFNHNAASPGHFVVGIQPQQQALDQGRSQQFGNFFPTSAAFRGTPPPSYEQEDFLHASQPSAFQLPPQYEPYSSVRTGHTFHTNQHLPQPFHPQSQRFPFDISPSVELQNYNDYDDKVRTTQNYINLQHPQGIVDQLDSGNRWRNNQRNKKPAYDDDSQDSSISNAAGYFQGLGQEVTDIPKKKTSRGTPATRRPPRREESSSNEEITRGRARFRNRIEPKVQVTTYTPPSQRVRSRFNRPVELKKIITTGSTTSTTSTTTTTTPEPYIDSTDQDYELEYILSEEPGDTEESFDAAPAPIVKPGFGLNATNFNPSRIKFDDDVRAFLPLGYVYDENKNEGKEVSSSTTKAPTTTTEGTAASNAASSTTTNSTTRPTTNFRITNTTTTTQAPTTSSTTSKTTTTPPPTTITAEKTVTNQVKAPSDDPDAAQPTESWVIVASVQTSRSVSGARFLPGLVKQEETQRPLSPNGTIEKETTEPPIISTIKEETTPAPKPASTESINDKLDRVQSQLSDARFLDGFKPGSDKLEIPDMAPKNKTSTKGSTTTTEPSSTVSTTLTTSPSSSTTTTTEASSSHPPRKFIPAGKRTTIKPKKSVIDSVQYDELSGLLPAGFKPRTPFRPKEMQKDSPSREGNARSAGGTFKNKVHEDKKNDTTTSSKSKDIESIIGKITFDDVSSLLPPGYTPEKVKSKNSTTEKTEKPKVALNKFDIPSNLLPPGYKAPVEKEDTPQSISVDSILNKVKLQDVSGLLPPGFKINSTEGATESTEKPAGETTTLPPSGKVVFPTRPGGNRKPPPSRKISGPSPVTPKIQKGWPVRASTEFTGWPTPSTTPISVEKILEQARQNAAKAAAEAAATSTSTTTTTTSTTTTTTTPKPTTPGLCTDDCDMAATIRLVGGAKWVPELLDHNTLEWQQLANEVANQLEAVYSSSESLSKWYKKIRVDAFSEGSVLVDYFVELSELGRSVNTADMKRLFHESLARYTANQVALGNEPTPNNNSSVYRMGKFFIDPKYTDFIVLHRQVLPTVGYAEQDKLLPQWAIAVIVIGLASLLFVIIFGVTVLVNRHKSAKKKQPTALTEDMLNELNKNHMGGLDNFGADDLYNMEDVWNDKPPKKRSSGSIQENSMANLYDSWRSEWNGYYYNAYYGGNGGSSASGYGGRRRSDYDTNF